MVRVSDVGFMVHGSWVRVQGAGSRLIKREIVRAQGVGSSGCRNLSAPSQARGSGLRGWFCACKGVWGVGLMSDFSGGQGVGRVH